MTEAQHIVAIVFISLGAFFMFTGSIGIIRLPDFYSRSHAISKSDTLGIVLVLTGLIVYEGFTANSLKLIIAIVFIAVANTTGSHAIARVAFRSGLKPWFNKKKYDEK